MTLKKEALHYILCTSMDALQDYVIGKLDEKWEMHGWKDG